jgi:hypothetical protein
MADAVDNGSWDPEASAFYALYNSMQSGSISAAQTAYTQYLQALENPLNQMSSSTTPTQQFMSSVTALGAALNSGDMASAQSIYSPGFRDLGGSFLLVDATPGAYDALELDGQTTSFALIAAYETGSITDYESGSSYKAETSQIGTDFQNYDALLQENAKYMSDYLVSQGFSSKDATIFSESCYQVELPTGNQDTGLPQDATRAAQYVQALNQFAESYVASKSRIPPGDDQINQMLSQVMEATWASQENQIRSLLQDTPSTTSATQSSGGQAASSTQ